MRLRTSFSQTNLLVALGAEMLCIFTLYKDKDKSKVSIYIFSSVQKQQGSRNYLVHNARNPCARPAKETAYTNPNPCFTSDLLICDRRYIFLTILARHLRRLPKNTE